MKVLIISILLVITLGCKRNQPANEAADSARIEFPANEFDYGDISFNGDGRAEFVFTNTSNIPLIINNVRTSCGCTNPDWPRKPIEPGEQGKISVNYNTSITGSFRKSITVYCNTDNSPIMLYIKGNVIAASDLN